MRKALLLACVAAAPNLVAVPVAHAHPDWHYEGGCGLALVRDVANTTDTRWDGAIWIAAVATDAQGTPAPTQQITVECELRINGATPGTIVFTASGVGATARAAEFALNLDPGDTVRICDKVAVENEFHKDCSDAAVYAPVPEPVYQLGEIFTDSACDEIGSLDGSTVDQPPAFDIRADGDIYAIGERVWVYDCPTSGDARRRYAAMYDLEPPIPDL